MLKSRHANALHWHASSPLSCDEDFSYSSFHFYVFLLDRMFVWEKVGCVCVCVAGAVTMIVLISVL